MNNVYRIRAEYKVIKFLEVPVPEGADPWNPENWLEIESEHDADCYLSDILDVTKED